MRSLTPGVPPPIIMISGKASTKDVIKGLQAGACDYITKPFQPQVRAAPSLKIMNVIPHIGHALLLAVLHWVRFSLGWFLQPPAAAWAAAARSRATGPDGDGTGAGPCAPAPQLANPPPQQHPVPLLQTSLHPPPIKPVPTSCL